MTAPNMPFKTVPDRIFEFLISNVSGERYETLAKKLFSAEYGDEYVPLGGMHDAGADGFFLPHVSASNKPTTFYQFSVTDEKRAKAKVSDTVEALRKVGRDPRQVIYSTTESLPKADVIAQEIFEQFQVLLIVRDRERLKQLVNSNAKANSVFYKEFASDILSLVHAADSLSGSVNEFVDDPTVFAFLDYELKDRFSKDHLNERILDSLIYWSLRDTDPEAGKFLLRGEISNAIATIFPAAKSVLMPSLNARLAELSKKLPGNQERIRHYAKEDHFCLPFEMRKELATRALEELGTQETFVESIKARIATASGGLVKDEQLDLLGQVVFDTVHAYFVEQGMILAAFLDNKVADLTITEQIVEDQVGRILQKSKRKEKISPEMIGNMMRALRGVFYDPNENDRKYLGYLSRTSLLYMTLQSAPRVIEYFNQMSGNFRLLVGTDILVKAISEQHLPVEKRQVDNLLKICVELGATLILTEPVLAEFFTHLHAVDLEYRNHYLPNEAYLTPEEVGECNRILIRSYYYARFSGVRVSWDKFVNDLLTPSDLRAKSEKGKNDLRGLLVQRFNMEYVSKEELEAGVNARDVAKLADKLALARAGEKHPELSANDALMTYAVYSQRRRLKESAKYDGFGYRTWWLTKETRVLQFTGELVSKEGGVPYIMRPEFLLNFVALAPSASAVRESFKQLLPSTVGLQLGQHLKPEIMQQLLAGTEEWASLPKDRVTIIIGERVNRLKFDRYKQYTANI